MRVLTDAPSTHHCISSWDEVVSGRNRVKEDGKYFCFWFFLCFIVSIHCLPLPTTFVKDTVTFKTLQGRAKRASLAKASCCSCPCWRTQQTSAKSLSAQAAGRDKAGSSDLAVPKPGWKHSPAAGPASRPWPSTPLAWRSKSRFCLCCCQVPGCQEGGDSGFLVPAGSLSLTPAGGRASSGAARISSDP